MMAGTVPHHQAVTPDSNSPRSDEPLTKIEFTAATRPRISSGVSDWTMVWRITTLI